MIRLVLPMNVLSELRKHPPHLDVTVGRSEIEGGIELLASALRLAERRFRLILNETAELPAYLPDDLDGVLVIGIGSNRGKTTGVAVRYANRLEPIDEVLVVGPGMHRISLVDIDRSSLNSDESDRWSRTIGGMGHNAWTRLVGLRFVLIGTGRTGTQMARALARIGVKNITLIDPDNVERWNLGESDDLISEEDLGKNKAIAFAGHLQTKYPGLRIDAIDQSVTHIKALTAIKHNDFVICTCDHDSARLAATAAATLYCRPILDVATGISLQRELRATVRLLMPGRCLWCAGLDPHAVAVLKSTHAETDFHRDRDWRQERAGSLSSLNQVATGFALRMIEDLIAERIRDSEWMQLEFRPQGRVRISYPPLPMNSSCPLCGALTGLGDEGVPLVPILIPSL